MKNREIKFRAWDKVLNKWNLSVEIDCFGNIQEYKFNGSAYYPKYFTPDNDTPEEATERFILCQFTGLLDKNGKEIYEGDIIKWVSSNPFSLGEIRKVKITYIEARYWCNTWNNKLGIYLGELLSEERCEVIGNIYENPELLNN